MYGTYQHCAFTVIRNFRLQNLLASCIRVPTSPAWNAAGTLVLKRGFAGPFSVCTVVHRGEGGAFVAVQGLSHIRVLFRVRWRVLWLGR